MKKLLTLAVAVFVSFCATAFSQSRYDYSEVALAIVGDASTPVAKAEAIYLWLCANIDYDTTYSIHDADGCWDTKRGVCEAYCKLYQELGACVGLKVDVITGKSKGVDGNVDDRGHAWVFVYVDGNSGFLADPTWGAGSVDAGRFRRSDNPMLWYNVSPEIMAFTHFPDKESYQLLDKKITMEQFLSLPYLDAAMERYGFSPGDLLAAGLASELDIPKFYSQGAGVVWFDQCPLQSSMRVGGTYRFRLRYFPDRGIPQMMLFDSAYQSVSQDWDVVDGSYQVDFVPSSAGRAGLGYRFGESGDYTVVVEYNVVPPTRQDLDNLALVAPERSPLLVSLPGFDATLMKALGIDMHKLLSLVKSGQVKTLPKFYNITGVDYRLGEVPLSGTLKAGVQYAFDMAFSISGKVMFIQDGSCEGEFPVEAGKMYRMEYVPAKKGGLTVGFSLQGTKYHYVLGYEVK